MTDPDRWLSSEQAQARLKVRRATLYSYVSRGLIAARTDAHEPRRSRYSDGDIAVLLARKKRGRKRLEVSAGTMRWGDPVLTSAISTARAGRLIYRGHDAAKWSVRATLEQTAELLWQSRLPGSVARDAGSIPHGSTSKERALAFLAGRCARDAPSFGRTPESLKADAWSLLFGYAEALAGRRIDGALHVGFAEAWQLSAKSAGLIRQALVLVADHELNASTFAARVAASTGAPLAGAALAGLATLTGPQHGEAAARCLAVLDRALAQGVEAEIAAMLAHGETIPGFGHLLYPSGDVRAETLLARLKPKAALAQFVRAAERATGEYANVDIALAVMTRQLGLPDDAPFVVFALGRMVGWLAHAIEQRMTGALIRPRADYVGA